MILRISIRYRLIVFRFNPLNSAICVAVKSSAKYRTNSRNFASEISDEDYHQRKLHDQRTTRMDVPLYEGAVGLLDEPFEDVLKSHTVDEALAVLEQCLTETQRRRYLLHTRDGQSTRQIAQAEGVSQHAIMDSLQESERRIKKFLKSAFSNGPKNEDK
jgi:DNA-directed RNA polymerase specialized sigma24 family protein